MCKIRKGVEKMYTTEQIAAMSCIQLSAMYADLRKPCDPKMPSSGVIKDKPRLVELIRRCLARDGDLVLADGETVRISEWDFRSERWRVRDVGALTVADVSGMIGIIDPNDRSMIPRGVRIKKMKQTSGVYQNPVASRVRRDDTIRVAVNQCLEEGLDTDAIIERIQSQYPESKFARYMVRLYRYRWNKERKCAQQS